MTDQAPARKKSVIEELRETTLTTGNFLTCSGNNYVEICADDQWVTMLTPDEADAYALQLLREAAFCRTAPPPASEDGPEPDDDDFDPRPEVRLKGSLDVQFGRSFRVKDLSAFACSMNKTNEESRGAVYSVFNKRKNSCFFVVDLEGLTDEEVALILEKTAALERAYHRTANGGLRFLLAFSGDLHAVDYFDAWDVLNKRYFLGKADQGCRDLSRFWRMPSFGSLVAHQEGDVLDNQHPYAPIGTREYLEEDVPKEVGRGLYRASPTGLDTSRLVYWVTGFVAGEAMPDLSLVGPPGCGKTVFAKRLADVRPCTIIDDGVVTGEGSPSIFLSNVEVPTPLGSTLIELPADLTFTYFDFFTMSLLKWALENEAPRNKTH